MRSSARAVGHVLDAEQVLRLAACRVPRSCATTRRVLLRAVST
jgi:hypothetical protein